MISIFRSTILLIGLSFSQFSYADSTATDLSNILNSVKTMQASFTQTVYDNHGKTIQQLFGKMALQRPGKFRWEVTKPIPQLIVANDSRLWIYDPDLEQVTIRSLKKGMDETPVFLLSQANTLLSKDFVVTLMKNRSPALRWFSLAPRSADSMFESIQIGFLNDDIQEMRLTDHLGHTTKIEFKNGKKNPALASALFVFKPRPNVDVIDETRKR